MTHYAYMLSVDRLQMEAHLGFYAEERAVPQVIEVTFRLYFDRPIACNLDDNADFFDYAKLSASLTEFAGSRHFNLIEFMGMEMFRHLRGVIDDLGGAGAKLWLQLNKINAPVPRLMGGASFIHSDLPAGATYIPSVGS